MQQCVIIIVFCLQNKAVQKKSPKKTASYCQTNLLFELFSFNVYIFDLFFHIAKLVYHYFCDDLHYLKTYYLCVNYSVIIIKL